MATAFIQSNVSHYLIRSHSGDFVDPLFNAVRGWCPEPLDEGSAAFIDLTALRGGCYDTAAFPILKRKLY